MLDSFAHFMSIIVSFATLVAGIFAALWAYTKYFLERGFLAPVQFYATCRKLGVFKDHIILDIGIHLHNLGSATLVARNIRLHLRYIGSEDQQLKLFKNPPLAGRLDFPTSLIKKERVDPSSLIPKKIRQNEEKLCQWTIKQKERPERGYLVLEHDTFVQPGVDQVYTFVTIVPKETLYLLTWCSFQYAQGPSKWQDRVSKMSRKLGLIQYSLDHVKVPHTVENVFELTSGAHAGD